jgi:hypothetical protein
MACLNVKLMKELMKAETVSGKDSHLINIDKNTFMIQSSEKEKNKFLALKHNKESDCYLFYNTLIANSLEEAIERLKRIVCTE